MQEFKESPNKYPLPPLLTCGMLAACYLLDRYLPLGWEPDQVSIFMRAAGMLLIVLAIILDLWSLFTFRKYGANIMPHKAASKIMMHGPYKISRNPIYLANVLLVAGFGFALGSQWFVIGAIILYFLLGEYAIKREEKHLEANFPMEWEYYRLHVRRWI